VTATTSRACVSLLHDGALVVCTDEGLAATVRTWLPLHAEPNPADAARGDGASIEVRATDASSDVDAIRDEESSLLLFAGVRAFDRPGDAVALQGASPASGRIVLGQRQAEIVVPRAERGDDVDPRSAADVYAMLTLCAAFLVGRLGGALVHAGAVVDPSGRAWLLAGDTHAGKTTTTVSLVDAGWSFLADDQVVLRRDEHGAIVAEGWPRHAHLDEGWSESVVTGTRTALDMRARWGERWRRRAPLGGLLFPNVAAGSPTATAPIHAATAFAGLVRQSPWLMADRGAAPAVIELLRDACSRPAFALTLGRDSYARGDVIADRLGPALSAAGVAER
jgi:hypothetical protein